MGNTKYIKSVLIAGILAVGYVNMALAVNPVVPSAPIKPTAPSMSKSTYKLEFTKLKGVEIVSIKQTSKTGIPVFEFAWKNVCEVCGWKEIGKHKSFARGTNGGLKSGFACFNCFKLNRKSSNRSTEYKWVIVKQ
jgi:hypothetical protein